MEFEVNKTNFLNCIESLCAIASSDLAKTNPVLENLLIEAQGDKLKISASNISIKALAVLDFGLEIKNEGKMLINAQRLLNVAKTFDKIIQFKLTDTQVTLSENKTKINLPVVCVEYPENYLKFASYDNEFKIKTGELKNAIAKVIDFKKPGSYDMLGGVNFRASSLDKTLKLCATNENALAVYSIPFNYELDFDFILPSNTASLLLKSLSGDEVKIKATEKQVFFEFENFSFESHLINGKFPKYEGIIPNYPESEVKSLTIYKKALEDLFKKTSVLKDFVTKKSSDGKKVVVYNIAFECGLLTKVKFSDKLEDYIEAEFKGEPLTISFNPEYVLMASKAIEADKITFLMSGPINPILFREDNYTAVVMPVCLRGQEI